MESAERNGRRMVVGTAAVAVALILAMTLTFTSVDSAVQSSEEAVSGGCIRGCSAPDPKREGETEPEVIEDESPEIRRPRADPSDEASPEYALPPTRLPPRDGVVREVEPPSVIGGNPFVCDDDTPFKVTWQQIGEVGLVKLRVTDTHQLNLFKACLCGTVEVEEPNPQAAPLLQTTFLVDIKHGGGIQSYELFAETYLKGNKGRYFRSSCLHDLIVDSPMGLYGSCAGRVEGEESAGECKVDRDCAKAGCANEVCVTTANARKVMSTCDNKPCYEILDECGCQEGKCRWSVLDSLPE